MSKLIRDKIPEIIRQNDGVEPKIRIVSDSVEFQSVLDTKLDEEIDELRNAPNKESRAEEIADVMEVLLAFAARDGYYPEQIEEIRLQKLAKR
jgi:predicted house-cleaning noncanonical NTP pyrophosphatase (MazG superfamily)